MNEDRLREIETWTVCEREQLTESENVLLDALAEACAEIRRSREAEKELESWLIKAHELEEELRRDRHAMEGADLEAAVGNEEAINRARAILDQRLRAHGEAPSDV